MEIQEKNNFTDRYNNLLNDLKAEVINLINNNPYYKDRYLDFDNYESNDIAQDILKDCMVQVYDEDDMCFYNAYVRKILLCDDSDIFITVFAPINDYYGADNVSMDVNTLYTLWNTLNKINNL